MSRAPRRLAVRAIGYYALHEAIPLFPVYSLLFRDRGLSIGEISSLLVIWSVAGFVLEVPSGALADIVPRRLVLIASALIYAAGFAAWTVAPTYWGFAAGFVAWGVSSALMSGTFEALVYDELTAVGATPAYTRLMGWANSAAMSANLAATLVAAPLYALGGYRLLGWVSVGAALTQAALGASLPAAPRTAGPEDEPEPESAGYVATLRAGLAEVLGTRAIRRGVILAALLSGFLAFDEYFALIARAHGMPTRIVPILTGITVVGQAVGAAFAGRADGIAVRWMAVALVGSAVLIAGGVIEGRWAGFAAIAVGYGLTTNLVIVAEARVQESITGPARATVTSVTGLLSECIALAVYGSIGLGTARFSITALVVGLTVPMVAVAALLPRWLPRPTR